LKNVNLSKNTLFCEFIKFSTSKIAIALAGKRGKKKRAAAYTQARVLWKE